ncbi:MAG: hypothetical protein Q4G26_13070 [Paracoccus sp. (in: a-proteobacteria)]|nr:hypothetical protein [Paracoccus sp. (in: a-proteobacteria)]
MTDRFVTRVNAFNANLSFQSPYAGEIRLFMHEVLARTSQGVELLPEQKALLYTDDMDRFTRVLSEWADIVETSALRLRKTLASGRIYEAVHHAIAWPSNQSQIYETVLDIYQFQDNRLLRNPYEASASARARLKAVFPINAKAEDPLEGRADAFESQLIRSGNPWA